MSLHPNSRASWWYKPFVMTEDEVAARLKISADEVRALAEKGKLTSARIGERFRFTERDISQFLSRAGSLGRPRQTKLIAGITAAVLLVVVATAWAIPWSQVIPGAVPLYSYMNFSSPPANTPPLDTGVGLYRALTPQESTGSGTAQNLSLYLESLHKSAKRFVWPLYVEVNTNHTGTNNDAVGVYSRLRNSGPGWATAVHAEAIINGAGTNVGYNTEMSPMVGGGRTIGMNLQAKNGYGGVVANKWSTEAINIQTDADAGWDTGIKFDGTRVNNGIRFMPDSSGQRAIWVQGDYTVGLDMGNLPIQMNAGTPVKLEETGQITLSFNREEQTIEFKRGNKLLGYISALEYSGKKMN